METTETELHSPCQGGEQCTEYLRPAASALPTVLISSEQTLVDRTAMPIMVNDRSGSHTSQKRTFS